MNGRDVVRLGLLSAPRRPIVTKYAHRTSGVPLRVNCSCATRKQLRGPLLSVKNASPCADLELATHKSRQVVIPTQHEHRIRSSAPVSITVRKPPPDRPAATDPGRVHIRTRRQIIQGALIVKYKHAGPGQSGAEEALRNEMLVSRGELVITLDLLLGIPFNQIIAD